jgi:methionyl aminopeptidase
MHNFIIKNLSSHAIDCYFQAGSAVAHALKLAQQITRPGTNVLALANLLEQDILDHGAEGLGFPANIGLDNIAAHYSPVIEDPMNLPDTGLVKIDLGAHMDGYIADAAITVNLGNTPGLYANLMNAVRDALYTAIGIIRPGISTRTVGIAIQSAIQKYEGLRPISNLGGHRVSQWDLHGSPFIPNISDAIDDYIFQEGDQMAVEPFSTNGYGAIRNGSDITIFEVKNIHKKKNLPQLERSRLIKFKEQFKNFPFSPRWIDFIPKDQISSTILKYYRQGILDGYHVFEERGNGLVAQQEHTMLISHDGATPTTWWEDFDYKSLWKS